MPDNFVLPDELKELLEEEDKPKPKQHFRSDSAVEDREVALFLNEGVNFQCPTKYGKYFGVKERTFNIKDHPISVLVRLGREYKKLDHDRDLIEKLDPQEQMAYLRGLLETHAPVFAKIIAIAVTGNSPFNAIKRWFYYHYFMDRLTPEMMRNLSTVIGEQNNIPDFYVSIRLMSSQIRMIQPPSLIETNPEG